ncbi:MAG: 4Fe-4S binding protein [Clostridia bacterium]|nr:4Fe-4S binding protein [Clostridia bacterium]
MTGNEALARGFYEAGGQLAASYPGSPTVGILTAVKNYEEVYGEFSINEKVAVEVGIGASFAGGRTMVSMKHVGLNIAADPFMTFTQTKVNGGFVLVTGDDPGMASSQNEQDNRIFAKFAHCPILDPSNSQEAKDFVGMALDMSEAYHCPVVMRITSRLCHSRSVVELGPRVTKENPGFSGELQHYAMIPPNTYQKQYDMKLRLEALEEAANTFEGNVYLPSDRKDVLILTSGLMYNNLMELDLGLSIYKLGMVYPLPIKKLEELSKSYERIFVLEEMMPFIEDELKLHGIACEGKAHFTFTGEIFSEMILEGLIKAGVVDSSLEIQETPVNTVARLPMFCAGCPHRPVYDILKKTKKKVIGDIGCYSLAVLPPFEVSNSVISMGASIGIAKGMAKINRMKGIQEPVIATIGDGTFFHSGITGMINMLHQNKDENITILILNNGLTAMTGGQENANTGHYIEAADMRVDIPALLKAAGLPAVQVIDQFDYKEAKRVINEAIKHEGLSIVMTTRPCALNFKIKEPAYYVDPEICIGCRSCLKTNCPPILMRAYEGMEKLKSSIDPTMCVGCSVCSQVCPVGAIKRSEVK